MTLTRRHFAAGALGAAIAPRFAGPLSPAAAPVLARAMPRSAIMASRISAHFGLPGLTLGADDARRLRDGAQFRLREPRRHSAIGPDTLFQVGSITKVMTAAVIQQLAAEGRIRLTTE